MAVNISAYSIRKPIPSILLFIVLCLLGWMSFMQLPVTRFPNIDVPVISVTVTQSGAAPAELETQVTKRIEDAVSGITGVKRLISTMNDGRSTTVVEFQLEVNVEKALNDVKDSVSKVRAELPRTVDEPIIEKIDVEGQAILTYAVASPGLTLEQLSWHVDDVVKRQLQGAKGVGRVTRIGGVEREIRITLEPDRLSALGITAADVNRQLRATNVDLAGGRGEVGGQEQTIRTLGGARTIEDLSNTKIVLSGGREVRLGELGDVKDVYEEPRTFARLNGETPVVSAAVYRAKGASDYDVKNVVLKKLEVLKKENPDITYTPIDDSVQYTYGNYRSAMTTLIEGALLAVVVVFIFLKNWRATLISCVALPLSIIPTFWVMDMMGFSLNLVSLLAITLVTGILVDDAIVEIENIVRHMRMGKSPYKASMEAADEIGLAVIAITLTIVAIFAPVSFMGGVAGQYFKQFGLVVAVAVLFSLLVARLITPMMAAYLMKPIKHEEAKDGWIMRGYTRFLAGTLRFRWLTLLAGIGVFAVSIWSTSLLPTGFIPPEDSARTVLALELPPGVTLETQRQKTDEAVRRIREIPEVTQVLIVGGSSPTGQREVRKAAAYVKLTPKTERKKKQRQLEAEIAAKVALVPDMRAWYINDRGERELSVTLVGTDPAGLQKAVAEIEGALRRDPQFRNVAAIAGVERPEIIVRPRDEEAARFGISTDAISEAVRVATIGDVGPALAKFNAGDRLIPIRVQVDEDARNDLRYVESMMLTTPTGTSVPLSAVADVSFGQGVSSIERYNRVRNVKIGMDLVGITTGQGLDIIMALPIMKNMPKGVGLLVTGDAEIQGEVFAGFIKAMGLGLVIVFGVLVLLFGSFFQPITIMLSLPLSIGGVIMALLLTNNPISMPVVIGILMLLGIVTKNAIMLVDFAVEAQAHGVSRNEAIIDAGRKRARPIVMTTIAMVAGMLPSAYGVGDGGEFRAPMAIGVVGGLLVSTVLSLVFVPSFYSIVDSIGNMSGRFFSRFVGPKEEDDVKPGMVTAQAGKPELRLAAE
ncbi:MAG: efflux RND transporter permease subunit [Beijerinckiaceae bacterium]